MIETLVIIFIGFVVWILLGAVAFAFIDTYAVIKGYLKEGELLAWFDSGDIICQQIGFAIWPYFIYIAFFSEHKFQEGK